MNFEGPEDEVLWANLYPPKTLTLKPPTPQYFRIWLHLATYTEGQQEFPQRKKAIWKHREKAAIWKSWREASEEMKSSDTLILDF